MADRLWVATRKGLFMLDREGPDWAIRERTFLGDPVTMVLPDGRDGSCYAAVGHGHFGAKLHRSEDGGVTWDEVTRPSYPEKPEGLEDRDPWGKEIPWKVDRI